MNQIEKTPRSEMLVQMPLWQRMICKWADKISAGHLTLYFPDGTGFDFHGKLPGPSANVQIRSKKLFWHLLCGGSLGFARSYIRGDWETSNLGEVLRFGVANEAAFSSILGMPTVSRWLARLRHYLRMNTRSGSKRNISFHYDLGNDFYRQWLDETMTYSSGLFSRHDQSLADAQREKYARILSQMNITQNDHVLEIGCGWGGFAEYAIKETGCRLTGITLSQEQMNFAQQRLAKAGLSERAEIRLQDYRDCNNRFDKIVSIEMFEAVGEENWPVYFDILGRLLVPGGRAMVQAITIAAERFERYRQNADFIQTYIFPGGMLPSPSVFTTLASRYHFTLQNAKFFGADYAKTLRLWDESFHAVWPNIAALGFDTRFKRMWHYYLHYCAVGFETKRIDVGQFLLVRE